MVQTTIHTGIQAITKALEEIKPGDMVRYGSEANGVSVGLNDAEYHVVLKLIEQLEAKGRIMRFHRDGYYVAQGVSPKIKAQVETWAKQVALPRQL